jgi:hypothetical protein
VALSDEDHPCPLFYICRASSYSLIASPAGPHACRWVTTWATTGCDYAGRHWTSMDLPLALPQASASSGLDLIRQESEARATWS